MAELITIDKDALVRAIYSSTDAGEVDARTIVDSVSAPPPAGAQQAVAWAAVHFGGKRNGKIYNTCDTREQIDAYIGQVHQSNDSITLTARPLVFADAAPPAAQGADCARCKGVGAVGDHNGERAVEISCDHCSGTGRALAAIPAPEAAPSAKEGEAEKAVSDLAQAVAFLDQVRVAAKNGEEVTSTGISRDASQWLERAARSVVSTLKGLTPAGGDRG